MTVMAFSTPGPTKPAAWYDEDATPPVIHGPYDTGQPEAKAASVEALASSPVFLRWEDKARAEAQLGL